jgi:amino acid adenylation domain-containing protein/non-ribosomal peptide synthase protein (TIGR01720 family)
MHKTQPRLHSLTSPQREIWLNQILHEGVPLYNVGGYVKIFGAIDPVLFEQSVNLLIQKHDSLRTVLTEVQDEDGIPTQTYAEKLTVTVPVRDFSDAARPDEDAMAWMQQRFIETFDLTGQSLFRYDLVKVSEDNYYWLIQYHQLIVDSYAVALLNRSLAGIYTKLANGQVPNLSNLSYVTFVDNDRAYLESAVFDKQRQYWLDKYPTLPEPLLSPRYRSRYTGKLISSGCEALYLPISFYNRLNAFAEQHEATLFHLLLGALYVYFTRTAQRDDLAIGLSMLNRANANFKKTTGLFTGVSPTLFKFDKNLSFADLLQQVNKTLKEDCRHQRFPVSEINRAVGLGLERSQLFDINLSYENHDNDACFAGINGQFTPILHHYEQTPLMIFMRDFHTQTDVKLDFIFNLSYFNRYDIQALQARFVTILKAVLEDSVSPIHALPIMTEQEIQQLQTWNDTTTDFPKDQTIIDLFERQVEKTPDNIALVFEQQQLSYSEMNRKVNQLAHYLLLKKDDGNCLIAIAVERSLEMVIGLLAILKVGAAYVPIDPSYPAARITYMLDDSAAPLLLTQSHLKEQFSELGHDCVVVCLDEVNFYEQPTENPAVNRQAEDLAYVIYTSGTTGTPKGILTPHQAVVNYLNFLSKTYKINNLDVVLQLASLSFDASVRDLIGPITRGARVILINHTDFKQPSILLSLIKAHQVSCLLSVVPTLLKGLLESTEEKNLPYDSLRLILLSGEVLHQSLCQKAKEVFAQDTLMVNQYGPSESTMTSTYHPVDVSVSCLENLPIGKPIANAKIHILDKSNQPQPPGVPGELCIAGRGLARGYLNLPELTAERFTEVELFGKTERIYKTGDSAQWLPDGNLEYLGRIDHQVKLRGFRIELGEIETTLRQHPAVKEAVVTLYEGDDNKRLVAYLTTDSESNDLVQALKDSLKSSLPDYMVPSHFSLLDHLPLTPNGKIDRKALPPPEIEISTGTKPKTPTENLLAGLWATVLKRKAINRDDNFFELGGHSLLATQLIARIRDSLQVELPVWAIFENPSVSTLATAIEAASGTVSLPAIEAQSKGSPKVLSFAQQRLWFLNQLEEKVSATYNMPAALQLDGQLELAALQQSLFWLQERHASLRSYFPTDAGQAQVQIQTIDGVGALPIYDLRLLTDEEQSAEIQSRANSHAITSFDLTQGPLFKAELLQINEGQSVLLLNMHHIISDGWSMDVFIHDWQQAYTAFSQGEKPSNPPLTIQYSDYAAWQRNWLQGAVLEQQLAYWGEKLAGTPELLELPTDTPRPPQQSYQGAQHKQRLSASLSQFITELSRQQGVTVFMTMLASFNILLSRYSRQNDICVGSPIANRTHSQTEGLIGFFVNTLVLRSKILPEEQSFIDWLLETRQTCLEAYAHQDIPFEMLVEQLQPARSLSHHPLFQVMLVLQNSEAEKLELPGLKVTALDSELPVAKFDLTLNLVEEGGQFHCTWEYATDLFEAETIERMAANFEVLLRSIVENPEESISHLQMLTEQEIQQLQTWNNTTTDYAQDASAPLSTGQTVVDLFEQQVEKTPDNIAVVFEQQQLSYSELNRKANQIAHYLLLKKGTESCLIAIAVERSLEMVIALLAILKAGAAYVPIDPSYPSTRIAYMLDDSAAPLLLTKSHLKAQLPELESECVVVCLDEVDFAGQSSKNPAVRRQAEDLAYVIYTSGSTGKPKGVAIEHYSPVQLIHWAHHTFDSAQLAGVLASTSICFDLSIFELFVPLSQGGCVIVVEDALQLQHMNKTLLPITLLNTVPSAATALLNTEAIPKSVQVINLAGEPLKKNLVQALYEATSVQQIYNLYGPSEDTTYSTFVSVAKESPFAPTIGQPIANTRIYILDAQNQPQPPCIPGELCIAGRGLARGYLNRSELTAEKFIEVELFGKAERIYKTGDLARWLPDGNLKFLGRIDHQVKLRGFRIELGEIESVINQQPAIKEVVVTLFEANDNKRLVAYLTTDSEPNDLVVKLKDTLKASLPNYMVPSHFTVLDKLPLTPNGKIDRKALPSPELNLTDAYETPRNDTEQQLAQIWSSLLKLNNISIHDNFFSLGGDSILSIQIVARARQDGLHFTPRDLFEHQTIAELARVVGFGVFVNAEQGLVTGKCLLTPIQHWFLEQNLPEYWHFNQTILLKVPVDLEVDALREALAAVLSHHDALRLRYSFNGNWQQSFAPLSDTVPLSIEDLSQCENPVAELKRLTQKYQTCLNPTDGPLTQMVLFKWKDSARLFWCIHHLAVDGVSWRILQEDLHTAYTQITAGQALQLPAKTSSFKVWAERLNYHAHSDVLSSELTDWQALPNLSLPVDNPSGENRLEYHQNYTITLNCKQTEALLRLVPTAYNTRINDVLLTALALVLADWTGKSHCLIDLEGHGRAALFDDIDLSRTVGWFTTIHPTALTLPSSSHSDLGATLKVVKEQLRGIHNEGIGYGLLTQLNGEILPKGEVLFNYLGQFDQGIEADLFVFSEETTSSDFSLKGHRAHLIDINGAISQGELRLNWSSSSDCLQAQTIKKLAEGYKIHLQNLISHCQSGRQGVTPSDFPLALVAQSTLDALYTQYSGLQDLYPLSPMQQGMLFHALYEPETGVYFEQMQLTLSNLEPAAFKAAWQHQLERHPILRSAFLTDHQPILQVIEAAAPLLWREHDWQDMSSETQDLQLNTLLQEERGKGFDLSQAPLMRFDLVRLDEKRYIFVQHFHHILLDGWCLPIILREVRNSYLAFKHGLTPQLATLRPYRDYIAWLQQQNHSESQLYWQQRLVGFIAPTPLSIIKAKTGAPDYREVSYCLDAESTQRLEHFQKAQRLTLNTLVQGAWALLLSRYSRESDLCFGVTVSGRNASLPGIEQMIGLFINTLPLRIEANPEYCVKDYLQQIQTQQQNDNRYSHSSLFEIQANSEVPNGTALFESLLVFENYPSDDALAQQDDCYQIESMQTIEYTNYPLTVAVIPGEALRFTITYDKNRISFESIERLWSHLNTLLNAIVDNPEQSLSHLLILTEQEVHQLQNWNDTATDFPKDQTIIDVFEQQVSKNPDNIAVVFGSQHLTYFQLNEKANQLAHYLLSIKSKDGTVLVVNNPLIAIVVERSLEMVIGLLGILKAGGAYVPIDPSYPPARIGYMLDDSAASLLLTQNHLKTHLLLHDLKHDCAVVCLEDVDLALIENPLINSRMCDLAYVIYTSGSTGNPKGVMIEHSALSNFVHSSINTYSIKSHDKILQFASFSFDAAAEEIYPTLLQGATLILRSRKILGTPKDFLKTCDEQELTVLDLPTAYWHSLLSDMEIINKYWPKSIRLVLIGGEAVSGEKVRIWLENFGCFPALLNTYGPTETTVVATLFQFNAFSITDAVTASIGQPIANTRTYILDEQLRLLPSTIPGELCIAGAGLARGYLNQPELTNEKFIEIQLFGQTERIYRTGDLAKWQPDGNIEYLGRLDHQVKLRGYRIELGEIEAILSRHQFIKEAVVVIYDADDNKRLVAYISVRRMKDEEFKLLKTKLREWLKERLPDYMIPNHFTVLNSLPLTPNGKIDRKALLMEPDLVIDTDGVTPQTEIEQSIAQVWQKVLGLEKVGIYNNFFEVGGHSLLMVNVYNELQSIFGQSLSMVDMFQYPNIHSLAQHLSQEQPIKSVPTPAEKTRHSKDIAIIGMAGRFPGAKNIEAFWQNLRDGVESITFFSEEELLAAGIDPLLLKNPSYVKASGVLDNIELFDAAFFGISPREAEIIDPQQRLFLECAWEAIENAGYNVDKIEGLVGIYAGVGMSGYLLNNLYPNRDLLAESVDDYQLMISNDKDFMPTRTSYKLNLKGPSVNVQTACSTSLVAVNLAVQSLLDGKCDMVLAGGVSIDIPTKTGYMYQPNMISSPDGHCRAFDAKAQGTVGGSGAGIVVLKTLEKALADGDYIHAVIKGSAINNDGSVKVGYTAPSVDGQAAVITAAMQGISYESISYIEAHGTGTILGDPIEIAALTQAYRAQTQKQSFCAIGSVKSNLGHLDVAAGVTSLIKTVLALKHQILPPSLHFKQPNPEIDFANSPFFVNTQLTPWQSEDTPRRAGVSSFGIGGTNAHLVLEEAPVMLAENCSSDTCRSWQLLILSAKTELALETAATNLSQHFQQYSALNLTDIAYTLSVGRKCFKHRRMLVCQTLDNALNVLNNNEPTELFTQVQASEDRQVVFMFSGQGSQYANMTLGLYQQERIFREQVDNCAKILRPHLNFDLREMLYPSSETDEAKQQLEQTAITQPVLFVIEYALAQLWMAWGVKPVAMIGHSIGEYVAACLAGVLSLEDALKLVTIRGRLMQSMPTGSMLSVRQPAEKIQSLLTSELSLAAHNAPNLCVVSGVSSAIETLANQLEVQQIECQLLHTSHAFHSSLMEPILVAFREQLVSVKLNPPQIPYISNLSGTWITERQATNPDYWCQHLRQTVQFSEGLQVLLENTDYACLEIGPGRALTTLARQNNASLVFNSLRTATFEQEDVAFLLTTLGKLWQAGVAIDWPGVYAQEQCKRLPLPTYSFDRQRYWIEPPVKGQVENSENKSNKKSDLTKWFYLPIWKPTVPLAMQPTSKTLAISRWLVFVDNCGLGTQLVKKLNQAGHKVITVQIGDKFTRLGEYHYSLNPQLSSDYEILFEKLYNTEQSPQAIIHLWSVTAENNNQLEFEQLGQAQTLGFYSLLFLAQSLKQECTEDVQLMVVSNQMQPVTGEEVLQPEKATLLGPVKVIGQEYPHINCRSIDIILPSLETDKGGGGIIEKLIAEFMTSSSDRVVAYREQRRWVQTYEPIQIDKTVKKHSYLKENGVYLITGGLGGIGLVLAEHLAKTRKAQLILIGRSSIPPKQEWDSWLTTHDNDNVISSKIQKIKVLEALGAEVLVASANVADLSQMQAVITVAKEKFGTIHGVIHAAGVPSGGVIQRKTPEVAASILNSKVKGTLVLHTLLGQTKLDFFVLCSSLTAILETLGQVDYCAANAFMDNFTHYLRTQDIEATSINWDNWLEVGMAVNTVTPIELQEMQSKGLKEEGILPAEGIEAFNYIIGTRMPQILVSTQDLVEQLEQSRVPGYLLLEDVIDKTNFSCALHSRPELSSTFVEPRNSLEQTLLGIWQTLLGIESIGIYDDFFELGGDSLLGMRVISKVREVFKVSLPLHDMFNRPTVAAIVESIEARRVQETSRIAENLDLDDGQYEEGKL